MKDPFNVTSMKKITEPINDETKKILKRLTTAKNSIQVDEIINTLNNYVQGAINIRNPLNIAENLHNGNYIERVNTSQLWTMKRFYDMVHYNVGLIDVGKNFLSQKNYHGAFESFHSAKYSQGLLDMTKNIVDEVKKGNRNNIGYAKKALVDIVQFEGKERAKEYINTIADAYMAEHKALMKMPHHHNDNTYLYDALGLYRLNNNVLGIAKTSTKIAYHKLAHHKENPNNKRIEMDNHFHA
jgi:hypothetical protein